MIRYIGPKKIKGTVEFGTGDPSSTGLILGGVSLCKVAYQKDVSITPNFEEKCLVGNATVKGRVRVVYFVRMALRIWFDKDVHRLCRVVRAGVRNIQIPAPYVAQIHIGLNERRGVGRKGYDPDLVHK